MRAAASQRRTRDVAGDRVGGFRPVDHAPRHHHVLDMRARPFEVSDRDLAMHALLERLHELARGERGDVAFRLQRLLFRVHRIGDVDREHELDVDRDRARPVVDAQRRDWRRNPADADERKRRQTDGGECNHRGTPHKVLHCESQDVGMRQRQWKASSAQPSAVPGHVPFRRIGTCPGFLEWSHFLRRTGVHFAGKCSNQMRMAWSACV